MTETIILIPARKGDRDKNSWNIDDGETLVYRAARTSRETCFPTWISTDCFGPIAGAYVHKRKSEHAKGDIPVHRWVLDDFLPQLENKPKILVLVQPTSPFLRVQDIYNVVYELMRRPELASAQTITRVQHNSHDLNQRGLDDGRTFFLKEDERARCFNSQLKPERWVFGNCVATRVSHLERGFFAQPSAGIEIDRISAFDVDDETDLKIARALAQTYGL